MLLDERYLEQELQRALGLPLRVSVARAPLGEEALSPAERSRAPVPRGTRGEQAWLRGRAALKRLLARLGEETDTASLRFPHPRLSLSHTGRWAVAVGLGRGAEVEGLGVDLERGRTPPAGSERFFLAVAEQSWLAAVEPERRPWESLRLWTTKEALFKACPANAGALLGDYRLLDPAAWTGRAGKVGESGILWRYSTLSLAEGFLTVGVGEASPPPGVGAAGWSHHAA
jgi:4'-phosphopantetheinyl transferase superfamily protein